MKKVKEFLKKLLERFKGLFKRSEKVEATPVATPSTESTVEAPKPSDGGVSPSIPVGSPTDNWLRSGAGYGKPDAPNTGSQSPSVFDDGIVRYNHHTYVHGPKFAVSTEALTGPTRVSFTYTSQEGDKKSPTKLSAQGTDGSLITDMQMGVGTDLFLKQEAGIVTIVGSTDSEGRVIAQLFKV